MTTRIKQLKSAFTQQSIDAFLVQSDINITYLTGFPACESWLFITPKKTYYITDFRYILEARKGLKGIVIKQYTKSIYETLFSIVKDQKIKRIGIDERHLVLAQYKILAQKCPKKAKLVKADNLVEYLREIKDANEIARIKKALRIHKQAHQFLKKIIKPKISEKDVLQKLTNFVQSKGVGFSFDPIVACGPNSAYPHAKVTDRKIRMNEPVLIDMGIDVEGYKSDLTRMFFLGKIPELVRQVNDHVDRARQAAIGKVQAGISIAKVDFEARNYLKNHGLAKYFGHALGHGIGLEVHEDPRLAQNNPAVLREGMVITVEPAVYIPNKFGIRIEDMVLVTKKGCKVLSGDIN